MEVVFGLVGVSVLLLVVITVVLLWAVRSGQFEDMEGPAWRVLMDDDRPRAGRDGNAGPPAPDGEPIDHGQDHRDPPA